MGGPQSAQPAAANRPAGSGALVLLAGSASAAERVLVARWLRDGRLRPSAVLPLDGPDLARSLERAVPETVVTAVRVACAATRTRRRTAGPLVGRAVAGQPGAAAGVLAEPDHAAGAGPGPDGGRGASHRGRAARPVGWHRLIRSVCVPAGQTRAGPIRAGAARVPVQGAEGSHRRDRGQPALPCRGRPARGPAGPDRAGSDGARRGGPGQPGCLDEPDRGRPAVQHAAPAARPRVGRTGRHESRGAAARAQRERRACLPTQPPLLPRSARAATRTPAQRLPPQPRAGRQQRGLLADRPGRPAQTATCSSGAA